MMRTTVKRVLASRLPSGSPQLRNLVMDRISRERCMECGGPRRGPFGYCESCLATFPIRTVVGEPFGGWRYEVWQTCPAYDAPAFRAVRIGIFEYERRGAQWIGEVDTFESAKQLCLKSLERSMRAAWY